MIGISNAEKFKSVFGLYATELWAMPEEEFLGWLNSAYDGDDEVIRCRDCGYFDKHTTLPEVYLWDGFCEYWRGNTYNEWFCIKAKNREAKNR